MSLNINAFKQVANSSWFNNEIVVNKSCDGISSHFFHSRVEKGNANFTTNQVTLGAFKAALVEEFGMFGQNAFNAVLGKRAEDGLCLRKNDVFKAIRLAEQNIGLSRGGIIAIAEPTLTKLFESDSALSRLSPEAQKDLRTRTLSKLEANLDTDAAVREFNSDMDGKAGRFEEYLRDLALSLMREGNEEVLDAE